MTAPVDAGWRNPDGTTERVAFLGEPGRQIFAVTHEPEGRPIGGLVICSPILLEQMRNYRREVVLARTLAAQGHLVQRFHYRATGHSDGHARDLVLPTMVEDAVTAAAAVTDSGIEQVGFLGTRVGALVAAQAAAGWPDAPLVLWEPVLGGRAYLRELGRAQLVGSLKAGGEDSPAEDPAAVLRRDGRVEILGFELTTDLVDSLSNVDLEVMLAARAGHVLLADSSPRGELRRAYGQLADGLAARRRQIDTVVVRDDAAGWWFPGSLSRAETSEQPLTDATTRWLAGTKQAEVAR